jgi:hypothetical protein
MAEIRRDRAEILLIIDLIVVRIIAEIAPRSHVGDAVGALAVLRAAR